MKLEIDWSQISLAEQIQMMYPAVPVWEEVDNETLVTLVETFNQEPNCATIALGELQIRSHPRTGELARWLLARADADQWLMAAARDIVESIS